MILDYWLQFMMLIFLLMVSAFFSGSETALFSLSQHRREEMEKSSNRYWRMAADLLKKPSDLLVAILLGNLVVNVLFFCVSAALSVRMSGDDALMQAAMAAVVLVSVIIFGEVLPKAFGISHAVKISAISALPLKIWLAFTLPFIRVILFCTDIFSGGRGTTQQGITTDELKMLLNYSADGGEISNFAGEMIEEVVELSCLWVKNIMTPRVDLVFCPVEYSVNEAVELGLKNRVYFLPVYDGQEDNVVGLVSVRRICLTERYKRNLSDFVIPVKFIPESKRCGQLLDEMISENLRTMVVVDEYGGIAGLVTLKDLMREVMGNMDPVLEDEREKVVQLAEDTYRVRGSLPITHWNDFFASPLEEDILRAGAVTTIGGFFISQLGRLPEVGDKVVFRNLEFVIEEMHGHRIGWVKLRIK